LEEKKGTEDMGQNSLRMFRLTFLVECAFIAIIVACIYTLTGNWISFCLAQTNAIQRSLAIINGDVVEPAETIGPPCCGIYAVIKVIDPSGGMEVVYERVLLPVRDSPWRCL